MKKRVLLSVLVVVIFFSFVFMVSAQVNGTAVSDALACLDDKVGDCSSLSPEEQIFTALATGQCINEVQESASNGECWPSGSCDIRMTALAVLALSQSGRQTADAEEWLLSQRQVPSELIWYLQVENPAGET
jgi:hypothetical protein